MRDVGQLLSIEPPKNFSDLPLRNFNEILVPTTNRIALETGAEEDDPFVQQAQEETADNLSFVDALQTPQDSPPERQNSELSPVPENVPLFQSESNPSSHSGSQASPQTLVSDGLQVDSMWTRALVTRSKASSLGLVTDLSLWTLTMRKISQLGALRSRFPKTPRQTKNGKPLRGRSRLKRS